LPVLATNPRVRSVDPTAYAAFATFSCGTSTDYEREVNEIVGKLHRGELPTEVVRVAEHPDSGDLIGLCVVSRRPFRTQRDAAYVQLIARSAASRGTRLPRGRRLGEFLLGDALEAIFGNWGFPMPAVWALVDPSNEASHAIFSHWGFALIPAEPGGYDARYRPSGIGLHPSQESATSDTL
jgi:ribosomal protein S18 acetylase RimI-like enzyme